MRCYIARCKRKVVVFFFFGLLANLIGSTGAAYAQTAPSVGVEPSSCLSLEEPKSPSAGTIAPIRDGGTIAGRVDRMRSLVMGASCRTLGPHAGEQVAFDASPRSIPSTARIGSKAHFSQARVVTSSMVQAGPTTFETFGTSHVRWSKSPSAATAAPSLHDDAANVGLGASTSPTTVPATGASLRMLGNTFAPEAAAGAALPATAVGGSLSSGVSTSPSPVRSPQPFATRALLPSGSGAIEP